MIFFLTLEGGRKKNVTSAGEVLPSVKVDAFSKIMRPSLGKLIWKVDAMLRPGGVLYVGFQSIATFCS